MIYTYQTILDQMNSITQMLNNMPANKNEPAFQALKKELGDIGSHIQAVQKDTNAQNADDTREILAGCRASLYRILKNIEMLQTEFADAYRQSIGDRKNEFEKWSDIMQKNFDPEAHQNKLVFGQLRACRDQIRLLTSSMMDVEGQLEHDRLAQKDLAADQPDVSHLGEASDRSSLSP